MSQDYFEKWTRAIQIRQTEDGGTSYDVSEAFGQAIGDTYLVTVRAILDVLEELRGRESVTQAEVENVIERIKEKRPTFDASGDLIITFPPKE